MYLHRSVGVRLALALMALLLAVCAAIPALAQSDKPEDLLLQLEAEFATHWPALHAFQESYVVQVGRYYQALESHSAPPADGGLMTVDRLQARPTDQGDSLSLLWSSTGLPAELAYSVRIDVYDGPDGRGYVVVLTTNVNGERWQRAINVGPETWRNLNWHLVPVEAGAR